MNKPVVSCRRCLSGAFLVGLLSFSNPSVAGMDWSARAIDPSLVESLKHDQKLLESTVFGEQPEFLLDRMKGKGVVSLSDPQVKAELNAWIAAHPPGSDDTAVDLDGEWHGIHYLLTGSADPDGSLASKVIFGGESIGKDLGYGPAQLLRPEEVKAIAQLLQKISPETLRKRYKPEEMARAGVYPTVVWVRDGDQGFQLLLEAFKRLTAFYTLAANHGQAVIFAIS
jgi:Domain of unknown function (DUF1877)